MRSKPVTVKTPWKLLEVFEVHAKQLGYESVPQFLIWTGVYSIMVGKPHRITVPIAQSSEAMQDQVIDDICERFNAGETFKESYLENLLADVLEKLGYAGKEDVVEAIIADHIKRRCAKTSSAPIPKPLKKPAKKPKKPLSQTDTK